MLKFYGEKKMNKQTRFAILVSGRGSNMDVLIEASKKAGFPGEIVLVISDNPEAEALKKAETAGVKAVFLSPGEQYKTRLTEEAEKNYVSLLKEYQVDYILLAGFMRMIKEILIKSFTNRIINIHPSLLPAFPGLDTHERAIEAGSTESGCSVHFVDLGMDTGRIIAQSIVSIKKDETPESLAAKVLEKEHKIYPYVMHLLAEGKIDPNKWEKVLI